MAAPETVVRLEAEFAALNDHWSPKLVGEINDMDIKAVKLLGEFVWHTHNDTDEFFLVRSRSLTIRMRGGTMW